MRRVTARQLIEMVESVDLRGRGGAAFPFARKVRAVVDTAAARKCKPMILINGTEGEPGSAKDKMLLLRSPYLVLGGALLAARALERQDDHHRGDGQRGGRLGGRGGPGRAGPQEDRPRGGGP